MAGCQTAGPYATGIGSHRAIRVAPITSIIRSYTKLDRTVMPRPRVLSIVDIASCIADGLRLMASPRPLPLNFRLIEASAW
jgi:hypothetical protein